MAEVTGVLRIPLSEHMDQWIYCQIGAREHYALAVEAARRGQLEKLITDYWQPVDAMLNFSTNLKGRRTDSLQDSAVISFNASFLFFEFMQRLQRIGGWELVMKRNEWFQRKVVYALKKNPLKATHLFSYTYAASEIFEYARQQGWKTVLGQIDPGPEEEKIVLEEVKRYPQYRSEWQPAPQGYWDNWYRECELADEIIVNSAWSLQALKKVGIAENKIKIVPLTYEPPASSHNFVCTYPTKFDAARPLRVLFLGQVILRKGIARLIEAAEKLKDAPVEFTVVGPIGISPLPNLPNVKWKGRAARMDTEQYFREADVFLFPTLSDGFGLTQLEARAWNLPVITTQFCGEVVRDGIDGIVLKNPSAESIKNCILEIINTPSILQKMSENLTVANIHEP